MKDRDPDRAILARVALSAFVYGFAGMILVLGLAHFCAGAGR